MFNDNLTIDKNDNINIPQNESTNFIFCQTFLKNSREIAIDPFGDVNTLNLFIIIKSFASNVVYVPHTMLILIKDSETFIAHNLDINKFKKITYSNFSFWFYNQLDSDWQYIKKKSLYSFAFTYPINIFDRELLPFLKPKYPWQSEILYKTIKTISEEVNYINIIEKQNKEIIELKKKIYEIKDRKNT